MIEGVQVVSVPVSDQDRARSFYIDTLGFELRTEDTFGEGMRWIEVTPHGSTTSLTLVTWFEAMSPGSLQGLVFSVDNVHATHDQLLAKGVSFDFPPTAGCVDTDLHTPCMHNRSSRLLGGTIRTHHAIRVNYTEIRCREMPGGLQAVFRDPDGNGFVIAGR